MFATIDQFHTYISFPPAIMHTINTNSFKRNYNWRWSEKRLFTFVTCPQPYGWNVSLIWGSFGYVSAGVLCPCLKSCKRKIKQQQHYQHEIFFRSLLIWLITSSRAWQWVAFYAKTKHIICELENSFTWFWPSQIKQKTKNQKKKTNYVSPLYATGLQMQ